jgi:hypothetical protein
MTTESRYNTARRNRPLLGNGISIRYVPRLYNKGPAGLGRENDCAGEDQQQLQTTDPASRQRGRPTSTNAQLSD